MIINADLRQIEVIMFAQLCKPKLLITLLNNGQDIHNFIGANLYGKTEEEITEEERDDTKKSTFGIIYGNGDKTLSDRTGKDIEWCKEFIKTFFTLFPEAKTWHQKCQETVEKTGSLTLFTGEILKFKKYPAKYDWQINKGITESYNPPDIKNHPVQHLAWIIMSIILGTFFRGYAIHNKDKYLMINTVHDSLMIDCKEDFIYDAINHVSNVVDKVPTIIYNKFNEKMVVPIKISMSMGDRWSDL